MTILLRDHRNRNPRPATIRAAEKSLWGYILIETDTELIQLAAEQHVWAALLAELAASFQPRTVADVMPTRMDVLSITPEQVIAYFEASDTLQPHAADVRAILEPLIGNRPASQAAQDAEQLRPLVEQLFVSGQPARGYTRRAAAVLFDDENKTGGSYLTRIKAAMNILGSKLTTTTTPAGPETADKQQRAA